MYDLCFEARRLRRVALCWLGLALAHAPALAAQARAARGLDESLLPRFAHLARLGRMAVPVAGVAPGSLRDSFLEARSRGRTHHAIDIPAPRGTPVLAVADGVVVGLRNGANSGLAIYVLDAARRQSHFYAHLDRYADRLAQGDTVRQGQVIGYVGDSGNAGAGNYHLHFAVLALADLRRWWEGDTVNPFALLRDADPVR